MGERIRVAIIAGQLVVGGAERQLYLWLANLDRERFQPLVITLHPGCGDYWEAPIEALGIPLVRIPRRSSRILRLVQITRALKPFHPELIHGWHRFSSMYAAAAARLLGAKSLGGIRHSFSEFRRHPLETKLLLNLLDGLISNSSAVAEQLEAVRRRGKPAVFSVQNGVEIQTGDRAAARERIARQFGIPIQPLWLGSIGRLERKKNFDVLIQLSAELKNDLPDFRLLLIGDGPERPHLEAYTKELNISDRVIFLGEQPGAGAWVGALDIFCFASSDEGLPNVVLEAAAASLPVAAWRMPFIEEILEDKKMTLLADPGDISSFRANLQALCRSKPLRSVLGQAASAHVQAHFSLDRYIRRMSEVYEQVLSG